MNIEIIGKVLFYFIFYFGWFGGVLYLCDELKKIYIKLKETKLKK